MNQICVLFLAEMYGRKYKFRTGFDRTGSNLVVLSRKQCSSIHQILFKTCFLAQKLYVQKLLCSSHSRNVGDMALCPWAKFEGPMQKIYKDIKRDPKFF